MKAAPLARRFLQKASKGLSAPRQKMPAPILHPASQTRPAASNPSHKARNGYKGQNGKREVHGIVTRLSHRVYGGPAILIFE